MGGRTTAHFVIYIQRNYKSVHRMGEGVCGSALQPPMKFQPKQNIWFVRGDGGGSRGFFRFWETFQLKNDHHANDASAAKKYVYPVSCIQSQEISCQKKNAIIIQPKLKVS